MGVELKDFFRTGWNQRPWYISLLVAAVLTNFPPVHTVDFRPTPTKFGNLGKDIQAGDVVVVPSQKENIKLNSQSLSKIEDNDHSFGVVSVYSHSPVVLNFIPNQYSNWREGLKRYFRGPILTWNYQVIDVRKKKLNQSKNLRLPTAVIQRLSMVDKDTRKKERKKVRKVLKNYSGEISSACFKLPVDSKRISHYASPRRLPSGREYYHTGLDLRAWYGTPIKSASTGKLVLQEHMTAPGNNVILSHGGGLFSRYMHFSKFGKQKLGDRVPASEVIGYSGSTGRSQAPHLHFEIIWKGNHASPLLFLRTWEQICDQG